MQAEFPTLVAFNTQQAQDFGVFRAFHLIYVRTGYAFFFSGDRRVKHPSDDVRPLIIPMPCGGAEGLFGDDFGQHDMTVWVRKCRSRCGKARGISGIDVTTVRDVVLSRFVVGLDRDRFVLHAVRVKVIREVEFGRGTGLNAH